MNPHALAPLLMLVGLAGCTSLPVTKAPTDTTSSTSSTSSTFCFVAGTPVRIPGGEAPIETLEVGDPVLSWSGTRGLVVRPVTRTMDREVPRTVVLDLGDRVIETTEEHPFYSLSEDAWVEAGKLVPGTELGLLDLESLAPIELLEVSVRHQRTSVFNLTVGGPEHDYFADEVLVHNKGVGGYTYYLEGTTDLFQWPVESGGNGHTYLAVFQPSLSWNQAEADAATYEVGGVVPRLADLNSAEEEAFVNDVVLAGWNASVYLGALQDTAGAEPDGGWTWTSGAPWDYVNWAAGEPNNAGPGGEDALQLWPGVYASQGWNDIPRGNRDSSGGIGMLLEYDGLVAAPGTGTGTGTGMGTGTGTGMGTGTGSGAGTGTGGTP